MNRLSRRFLRLEDRLTRPVSEGSGPAEMIRERRLVVTRASHSADCFTDSRRNCRDQEPRQDANLPVAEAVPVH